MPVLPMFPLGMVLFPGEVLPLNVFELRYRALVRDCLEGDREFGVVLIERGSEVGGGDVRSNVGTVARILQVAETPDGRFVLVTVGIRRIRVTAWLDDDPYPRAEVEDWPDDPTAPEVTPARLDESVGRLRRLLALKAELGEPVAPATVPIDDDDPLLGSYRAAAVAPFGPADRFDLLVTSSPQARLRLLDVLVDNAEELCLMQLGAGEPGGSADWGPGPG